MAEEVDDLVSYITRDFVIYTGQVMF